MNRGGTFLEIYWKAILLKQKLPKLISWGITNVCNLRCGYCDYWENTKQDSSDLPLQEVKKIATWLRQSGCEAISLTGGECLTRDDILEIVAHLKQLGFYVKINTNGTLLEKREAVARLADTFALTLDGPEQYNDSGRGYGTYRRVMKGVELLQKLKKPRHFQVGLRTQSIEDIRALFEISRQTGARCVYQPVIETTLEKGKPNHLVPEVSHYREIIRFLKGEKKRGNPTIINSLAGLTHLEKWPEPTSIACSGGRFSFRIRNDGTITNCPRNERSKVPWNGSGYPVLPDSIACKHCWCGILVETNLIFFGNLNSILNMARRPL